MKRFVEIACWFIILGTFFVFFFFSVTPYKIARYSGEGSMYPFLKVGDLIITKEVNLKKSNGNKKRHDHYF